MIIEPFTPQNRADFEPLVELLVDGIEETTFAPVDIAKSCRQAWTVIEQGMTFVSRETPGGKITGSIGMEKLSFWYSQGEFLQNRWLYVGREARFGLVGVRLMQAARKAADERELPAFVVISTPRRERANEAALYAQVAGFMPKSYILRLTRRRAA